MTREASSDENAPPKRERRKRFGKADEPEHSLTPMKLETLQLVAESKFLSTPQVASLSGKSDRAIREHLSDLKNHGLLARMAVPGVVVGSKAVLGPDVHYPTKEGLKKLEQWDMLPDNAARPAAYAPAKFSHIEHELHIRDVLVWLTCSARKHAGQGHSVEQWDCSSHLTIPGATCDALFTYRFEPGEEGRRVNGLVEVDMGTERGTGRNRHDRWAAKFEAYGALFGEESRDTLFALAGVRLARLVVTVPTQERAAWLLHRSEDFEIARNLWVAVRSELPPADVYSSVWQRPDGKRHSFVPLPQGKG